MRALTILVAVLAALWSGWWLVGRAGVQAALDRAPAAAATQGWEVSWTDASTGGFPNRFDTRLEAPRAVDPTGEVEWTAPFLDILMLSYRPNHAIVAFPPEQTVTVMGLPVVVRSGRMRASVVAGPALPPVLDRATLEGEALAVETLGAVSTVAAARAATRWAEDGSGYDVALALSDVTIPDPAAGMLAEGGMPAAIGIVRLDATARMAAPVALGPGAPPQVAGLDLRDVAVVWGEVRLSGEGTLDVDRAGRAQGLVTVRAEGWERLLDLAESQNMLPRSRRALVEAALRGVAGDDGVVEVPLAVRDGVVRFGPFELGRLPVLL
ncbi:DUF2125 domain-containing protein [Jannaschia sp. Os4]|uniref:DUF2125 domain-containing protein n=1 Tax=Jannaschia sp. Os4 TaxID=2807617 RepID=UPI00193A8B4E|nr:DUF2125 domain-containing protein [Jannaschia sp. Os4]MBM2576167.1 DUF2125 domain-containing protein [Jannaschia sp. Os4]